MEAKHDQEEVRAVRNVMIVHRGDWYGVTGDAANGREMVMRCRIGAQRVRDVLRWYGFRGWRRHDRFHEVSKQLELAVQRIRKSGRRGGRGRVGDRTSMIARLWSPQAGQVFGDGGGSEFFAGVCDSWIVGVGTDVTPRRSRHFSSR